MNNDIYKNSHGKQVLLIDRCRNVHTTREMVIYQNLLHPFGKCVENLDTFIKNFTYCGSLASSDTESLKSMTKSKKHDSITTRNWTSLSNRSLHSRNLRNNFTKSDQEDSIEEASKEKYKEEREYFLRQGNETRYLPDKKITDELFL